jgi:hypothetical protein
LGPERGTIELKRFFAAAAEKQIGLDLVVTHGGRNLVTDFA